MFYDQNCGYFSKEFSFNTNTDVQIEKFSKFLGFIKLNKQTEFRHF